MGTQVVSVQKLQDGTYEATEEDGTTHSALTSAAAADLVKYTEADFLEEFEELEDDEDTVEFDDVEMDGDYVDDEDDSD